MAHRHGYHLALIYAREYTWYFARNSGQSLDPEGLKHELDELTKHWSKPL